MDTSLVPVSQTEKWITTEPQYLGPIPTQYAYLAAAANYGIRNITPVDNRKTDVVE